VPLLDELNPAQREAVVSTQGPLLIIAGPGSGKTRVIVHRIAYLLGEAGVAPYNILAVTFTNKAAREMRDRLESLVGPDKARRLTVGTFHATCARWLRIDGQRLGLDPRFAIFDDGDQVDVVKQAMRDLEIDDKRFAARAVLSAISGAKSDLLSPEEYAARAETFWMSTVARIYRRYQEILAENRALDFDDLLNMAVQLFSEEADVLARYQERYRYILVDEFQDTNLTQYQLVKLLGAKHRNVCVVGDEDQSIYGWRKADIRNIFRFEEDFPELKVVILEQNYRSTQTILDVAHAVIGANTLRKEKRLWTNNPLGARVLLHEAYNEQDEALYVVRQIEALRRAGARLSDVAVMYRTNAQSRAVEDAMVRYGMPYRLIGGTRFYQRREIKDLLAYFRLVQNPADGVSLARIINVPPRGLGAKTLAELDRVAQRSGNSTYQAARRLAAAEGDALSPQLTARARRALGDFVALVEELRSCQPDSPLQELFDLIVDRTGYEGYLRDGTEEGDERWQNIQELRAKTGDYSELSPERALSSFLEEVALVQDVDDLEFGVADGATLITLHAAKGLEFPYVFIIGLEEGLCPHVRSETNEQLEEERRLLYVGITRAMRGLFLLHAFRRATFGSSGSNAPSRFLGDMPSELLEMSFSGSAGVPRASLAASGAVGRAGRWPPRDGRFGRGDEPDRSADRLRSGWSRADPESVEPDLGVIDDDLPYVDPDIDADEAPEGPPQADGVRRRWFGSRANQDGLPGRRPSRRGSSSRTPSFERGARVRHSDYGEGTVLVSTFAGPDELVLVRFDVRPDKPKNLSLAIHQLEPA